MLQRANRHSRALLQRANDIAEPCFTGRTVGVGNINSTKTVLRLRATTVPARRFLIILVEQWASILDARKPPRSSESTDFECRCLHEAATTSSNSSLYVWTRVYLQTQSSESTDFECRRLHEAATTATAVSTSGRSYPSRPAMASSSHDGFRSFIPFYPASSSSSPSPSAAGAAAGQ